MPKATSIVAYRERHDLSQTEFAKMIGVRQQDVSFFETGRRIPSRPILRKLVDLGFDLNVLLTAEPVHSGDHSE